MYCPPALNVAGFIWFPLLC